MNKQETKYLPPPPRPGALIVFPRSMPARGEPGFGVAKVLRRDGDDSWECQWYSNGSYRTQEDLEGPYLPCWDGPSGLYAAARPRHRTHEPLYTSNTYGWNVSREIIADCDFQLTDDHKVPEEVYRHIEDHPRFRWTRRST